MGADVPTRESLLLRLRDGGNDGAWSEFVTIYTPLIFGFCRKRGLGETDARDVTQDVLRAVSMALPRFKYQPERSSFRNWLFTVVRSKFNSFVSAQANRPRPAGETTLQRFVELTAEPADEDAWQREHQTQLVRWAADRIRAEFREATWDAFWRTAVQGDAAERVATELGLSLNAVYIARSRVTSRLRESITALGDSIDAAGGLLHA